MPNPFSELYYWLDQIGQWWTWITSYLPDKNGQLFVTIAGSLIGTFVGAYSAHKLAKWDRQRDEATDKIRAYNSAIMIAFDIGNSYLNFKEQQSLELLKTFKAAKIKFLEDREKGVEPIAVEFHLQSVTPFSSPFEKLEELAYSKIGLNGRPLHLVSNIIRSADTVSKMMNDRNTLVRIFHDTYPNNSPADNVKRYFGVADSTGITNTRISDNLEALYSATDDVIEFCRRLCLDLERNAGLLKKSHKLRSVTVNKTDFRIAEAKGIMPDPTKYKDWDDFEKAK